ncbi:Nuclear nucleic acid-binding protein C1D [Taenia crassiceps]|uniref:Nuclear nucleic acid-binding protein C1D n=1 Tax=Taenia crassiceps TaxID=6207 RepID=A0ABR4QNC0_9CEST
MKTSKIELSPIQRVQIELSLGYAMNALFFVYLRCHGLDVKDHPILKELERLTTCLKRCQNICSMRSSEISHSRLDKEASKRFVKRALWRSAQSKTKRKKASLWKYVYGWSQHLRSADLQDRPMSPSHLLDLALLLTAFAAVDSLKVKLREEGLRTLPSEMQPSFLKRLQALDDSELDIPTLFELYELEKRRTMPYSGGIFGR